MKKVFALLSDPEMAEFFDREKFARSSYFAAVLQAAADHYRKCGDVGPAARAFAVIESTRKYRAQPQKFCSDVGATLVEEKPLRLRRVGAATLVEVQPRPTVSPMKGVGSWKPVGKVAVLVRPRSDPLAAKLRVAGARAKAKKKKKGGRMDLLDSPAMYPGSFGAGKRR